MKDLEFMYPMHRDEFESARAYERYKSQLRVVEMRLFFTRTAIAAKKLGATKPEIAIALHDSLGNFLGGRR